MTETVDARGLPCPQPVILTRNAMRAAQEIVTLVSARNQVDNVRRLAERAGWQVRVEQREDGYALHLSAPAGQPAPASAPAPAPEDEACETPTRSVLVLGSEHLGRGEDALGAILVRSLLYTLTEIEARPQTLILYNTGARLAAVGSPVLDDLHKLVQQGVEVLVCGTCVDYLQLKGRIAVGTVSNMYAIAETLLSAGRVVSL